MKDVQRCGVASATSTGEIRYCIGYAGSVTFSQVFGDGSGIIRMDASRRYEREYGLGNGRHMLVHKIQLEKLSI